MVRTSLGRRCVMLMVTGLTAADAGRTRAQPIVPEPVFPNLLPPEPPAEFLAMPLYLQLPLRRPDGRPAFEATRLTVGQFLAVLPPVRRWRGGSTPDNAWRLWIEEMKLGGKTLTNVSMLFMEDNMAALHAVSFLSMSVGGVPSSATERDKIGRAVMELARNAT